MSPRGSARFEFFRDAKNAKRMKRLDRKASMGKGFKSSRSEKSEKGSTEREKVSELDKLKDEVAKKVRKSKLVVCDFLDKLDTQKFYKECPSKGKGTVEEKDFEDIIIEKIGFKATNTELDLL